MSEKVSYLTFIEDAGKDSNGSFVASYKCVCGKIVVKPKSKVKIFEVRSCGCMRYKLKSETIGTHGLSRHPLYDVWANMLRRCCNEKHHSYKRYGGRGVIVCNEWRNDFLNFYNWSISNGWQQGLELDKDIIGDGLIYSPDTCCFVTPKKNSNNKRTNVHLTVDGVTKTLSEWSDISGVNRTTISFRKSIGMSDADAINTPINDIRRRKKVLCISTGEIFKSTKHAAKSLGITSGGVSKACRGESKSTFNYKFKYV